MRYESLKLIDITIFNGLESKQIEHIEDKDLISRKEKMRKNDNVVKHCYILH